MPETTVGLLGFPSAMKGARPPEELLLGRKKIGLLALDKALEISDHILSVSSSEEQAEVMDSIAQERGVTLSSRVLEDSGSVRAVLSAAFELCEGGSLLIMPSSSPYVSTEVLGLMVELLDPRDGVFLKEKGGAVYESLYALKVGPAKAALEAGGDPENITDIIDALARTMAISWDAASALDPLHLSYFSVRTDSDYSTAKRLLARVTKA